MDSSYGELNELVHQRTLYRETSAVRPSTTLNTRNPLAYPIVQTNAAHGTIYDI